MNAAPMNDDRSCLVQCDAIRWEQFCGDVVLDRFNMASRDETKFYTKYIKENMFGFLLR